MKRTSILCPDCMKKNIIHEKDDDAYCDECGQQYKIVNNNTLTYK
jgi:Zn finger protein HypA/HybF involved in hydrogenase expression